MAGRDTSVAQAGDLTFVPEDSVGGLLAGAFFVLLGGVVAWFNLAGPDSNVWLLALGLCVAAFGLVAALPVFRRYPRLRLSGSLLWIETLLNHSEVLDLAELGAAHVVEKRYRNTRLLFLAFLRREEEQALLDSGRPVPRDLAAFYKALPLGGLIPNDNARAASIAGVVNARRDTSPIHLTPSQRAMHVRAVDRRSLVRLAILLLAALAMGLLALLLKAF